MASGLGLSATEDTVEQVLKRNYRYTVPDYQRQYSWGEEQWGAMWADIDAIPDNSDTNHFIGSIVLIERPTSLNEMAKLEIVDGQQRLATVSVILAVMREKYFSEGKDGQAEDIQDDYLKKTDLDRNEYNNLTLSTFDNPNFEKIIDRKYQQLDDDQLKEAVDFFRQKLDPLDIDEVDVLRKKLLASVTLVSITCEGEQSAFRLFETLNDRGLALSAVDLMKNYTFSKAASSHTVDYDKVRNDWETVIKTVIPNVDQPSRFFRHYIMSCAEPDYDGDVSDYKLYDEYQDIIDSKLPKLGISLNDYVEELAWQAELYVKIVNKDVDLFDKKANKDINAKLDDLDTINSTQARTLMLRILSEFNSANHVMESLITLEKFVLRWNIASYPTGGELDRLYSRICSNAFDSNNSVREIYNSLSDRAPTDDEFVAAIENKRVRLNNRTKYMLKRLEEEYYKGQPVEFDDYDQEHIAPRAAFSAKKYSAWPSHLNTTEGHFEQYRDRLGNLTLLESDKNIKIGADPFAEKRKVYENSDIKMTQQIAEDYDEWTIEEIEQRTTELAQAVIRIWDL
ncbi:DUF262 domain-containing protein [Haloferax volcanii]|uniref:DUF262 domain-containing protein n=1 Tax=Haloferax volcanii TaxID=2246 RepID=A0A6C0UTI3_HALVO|nr:DUF262 domain-containing protein [Haloferax alexandrinus]QIB78507.1 DUF262 domain-containing protein [Haloferax alexandrinus]